MDRETLIRQTLPVCRREARRWRHMQELDVEDLAADGAVGLVRASYRYDPDRGVPFKAYALPFIRGAILDTVRAFVKKRTLHDGTYAQITEYEPLLAMEDNEMETGGRPDLRSDTVRLVENREQLQLLADIPWRERFALVRTEVDGASAVEVAEELGVGANMVYKLVSHGSERLRRRAA